MLKVGLTGGIGSGKTLISGIFTRLGVPVFNADEQSKQLVNKDTEIKRKLIALYGEEIYVQSGINRKLLAEIIFNNQEELNKVNSIIHPRVRKAFLFWAGKYKKAPYVIEEAAILFESKAFLEMDYTINVYADELLRIKRVTGRDNIDAELVKSRISNQLSDEERERLADFTIYNDGKEMIIPQVLEIHKKLMSRII